MPRTIIVGDVHGCRDELERLLDHVGFAAGDRLVMVGDLVVRGPDPCGTIDLLRETGARSVRGNHEDRLLRWNAQNGDARGLSFGEYARATARVMRRRDWAFLEALPIWLDLPEHGIRVVHAGVLPGLPIERQDPRTLMYVRSLGRYGEANERRGRVLWGEAYAGPPHIVFGHNARRDPQIHPFATGIDTGAVYGGRLTAMVLRDGEAPPPAESRLDVLVSIPALKKYCGG